MTLVPKGESRSNIDSSDNYSPGAVWVVKIGSSILTANGKGLDVELIGD